MEIPQEEHATGTQRQWAQPWGNSPQERPEDKKRSTLPENLSNTLLRVSLKGHHQYKEAGESAVKAGKREKNGVDCFHVENQEHKPSIHSPVCIPTEAMGLGLREKF